MITPIIIVAIIILLALALVFMFNNLVALRNRVDNAWAQIDVQLQRRNDLIPNLVETVKGYAGHEKSTFQAVIDARSASVSARTVDEKAAAENQITSALRQLFALAEAYPELKANTNFLDLQGQLAGTEDKISYMRQSYNDTVLNYNNAIQTFPGVVVAGIFSFKPRENFDAIIEAETPPQVQF
ncbi:MAG: LemA family protein [Coriobacteriales bacterium]|nr:LemA family protein [Coriobacteriales bacterium]